MRRSIAPIAAALGTVLALSACTDPYDPGQRAVGGGLLGAGAGAAIGGLAGGGRGAAAGALIGGGVGAIGGAATTPRPPPPAYYFAASATASGLLSASAAQLLGVGEHRDWGTPYGSLGAEQSAQRRVLRQCFRRAALAQRRHVEVAFREARHGRAGNRERQLAQQCTRRRDAVDAPCGGSGRPVDARHVDRSAVGATLFIAQRRQHAVVRERSAAGVEIQASMIPAVESEWYITLPSGDQARPLAPRSPRPCALCGPAA